MSEYSIEDIKEFSDELRAFRSNNHLWGFINKSGEVIIEPIYTDIMPNFIKDVCLVEEGNLIESEYGYVKSYYTTNKTYYLIDKHGKRISSFYNSLSDINFEQKENYQKNDIYEKLLKEYKIVERKGNYFVVSNGACFDDIYGGVRCGLINEEGIELYPMEAFDITMISKDSFLIDKICEKYLLSISEDNELSIENINNIRLFRKK